MKTIGRLNCFVVKEDGCERKNFASISANACDTIQQKVNRNHVSNLDDLKNIPRRGSDLNRDFINCIAIRIVLLNNSTANSYRLNFCRHFGAVLRELEFIIVVTVLR